MKSACLAQPARALVVASFPSLRFDVKGPAAHWRRQCASFFLWQKVRIRVWRCKSTLDWSCFWSADGPVIYPLANGSVHRDRTAEGFQSAKPSSQQLVSNARGKTALDSKESSAARRKVPHLVGSSDTLAATVPAPRRIGASRRRIGARRIGAQPCKEGRRTRNQTPPPGSAPHREWVALQSCLS